MFASFSTYHHAQAFSEFLAYKTRVPVRGAIMLNERMDSVVLVKGWKKGANWSFPRGKINKDEPDLDCAVREVYEETGYDIKAAGLVGNEEEMKHIEVTMREQHMRLYVFRGVPMDTYFEPRTRKEISKIEWYKLSDLPTIRKKKQQQEGKGEDLAVNANKFYMVAPFLVPLKKWISAQRKLDKVKQSNGIVANPVDAEVVPAHIASHYAEEEIVLHSSNEDLGRLLDSLRQSALTGKTSDLPEKSGLSAESKDITAQLKSVLGVPSTQPMSSATGAAASVPISTSSTENQNPSPLLALLQRNPAAQAEQTPQTPFEQVVGFPPQPTSPPHPHHQTSRISTLPPPPTFPFPTTHDRSTTAPSSKPEPPQDSVGQAPQPPQVRSIPPLQQPAQLVSRVSKIEQKSVPGTEVKKIVAPYQRTGDPQFAQYSQVPGNIASSIPPACKLPPPKLTAQSSALLNLFKSGLPGKTAIANDDIKASEQGKAQTVPANPSANTAALLDILKGHEGIASPANQNKPESIQGPAFAFVPHQTLPKTPSVSANDIDRPKSAHQDKLLRLFRASPVAAAEPVKSAAEFLQPPSGPVELSAIPMSPGHSREPSRADSLPKDQVSKIARNGSAKGPKHLWQDTSKAHNPPVSATVNGPLNVPQFNMPTKVARETKHATRNDSHKKSPKKSPVTILSRPSSSYAHAATPTPKQQKAAVIPQIPTLVSPVKDMPPTPDLRGRPAPLKPFQPQILRRPAPAEDNEPSPIQPLPSPKHQLLVNRTTQPTDHKKSLLSLFTKPSPFVSPAVTAPTSAIDPASVVSPMSEKPTPGEQADAAFAPQMKNSRGLPQKVSGFSVPAAISPSRTSSVKAVVAGGGKKTPTARTTPVDRSFLLGYLEGVANGGR